MNSHLMGAIRLANKEFRDFAEQFLQIGEQVVEPCAAAPCLGSVLLRLKEVTSFLSAEPKLSDQTRETDREVLNYCESLKALRRVIEDLQLSLVAEKGRLETVQGNLKTKCAWATALRETS